MTRGTAARKRRTAPNPVQGIEIAFGGAKRSLPSRNWRHAMSTRTWTVFRQLFATPPLDSKNCARRRKK